LPLVTLGLPFEDVRWQWATRKKKRKAMIITIDGPAGAGKSTAARMLAERCTVPSPGHALLETLI
jgi:adenylylsulfate kinase-like enzyme